MRPRQAGKASARLLQERAVEARLTSANIPNLKTRVAKLTEGLPPKERAAVVLRYGYDLGYDEIGAALGSTEAAARQAASAGVRRLRKEST